MRVKGLKTYSNPIKKCAQKEVWVVNGTLNDMSSFQLSAKSHQKSKPLSASLEFQISSKCGLQMKICLK